MITVDESMFYHVAQKCGVIFDGMQQDGKGGHLPMFTHPAFGTFVMNPDESLQQAIERKRKQFTKPKETV
jgi:hypothetical protein